MGLGPCLYCRAEAPGEGSGGHITNKGCHLVRYWGLKASRHWMIPKDEPWKGSNCQLW